MSWKPRERADTQWNAAQAARRLANEHGVRYATFLMDKHGTAPYYVVAAADEIVFDGTLTASFTPNRPKPPR